MCLLKLLGINYSIVPYCRFCPKFCDMCVFYGRQLIYYHLIISCCCRYRFFYKHDETYIFSMPSDAAHASSSTRPAPAPARGVLKGGRSMSISEDAEAQGPSEGPGDGDRNRRSVVFRWILATYRIVLFTCVFVYNQGSLKRTNG